MNAPIQPPRLLVRADGNPQIGLGHLVRSLALAELLRPDWPAGWLLTQAPTPATRQAAQAAGLAVAALPPGPPAAELPHLATLVRPGDVVLLDGYEFNLTYQQTLRRLGARVALVSDFPGPVAADLLINHTPGVAPADYRPLPPAPHYCLGQAFSLLRAPFRAAAAPPPPPGPAASALICLGGADPRGLTLRALAALRQQPGLRRLSVVTGRAFAHGPALAAARGAPGPGAVAHYEDVTAAALVDLLQAHDLVLCSASTILIEALVLGRPAITGFYAANQGTLADYVQTHGQAFSVGDFTRLDDAGLAAALAAGRAWLAHTPRQPYAARLASPDEWRAAFRGLAGRGQAAGPRAAP